MDVVNEVNEFERKIRKRFNELSGTHSKYDLAEQDILHYIEFEKYDAATGSKLLKKLKEVRQERRKIKSEYEALQGVIMRINKGGLTNYRSKSKKYKYRTVTIESVLLDNIE